MKTNMMTCLLLAISFQANATSQTQGCVLLKQIQIEMSVAASNIANINTTRTPEGGPYLVQEFVCEAANCEIRSLPKIKKMFEPDHSDADENGYVAYPDIDLMGEMSEMIQLTRDYEEAAEICGPIVNRPDKSI